MQRNVLMVILFLFIGGTASAGPVAVLKEISNPGFDLIVEKNRLYVPEGHQIYIYSLDDYRLIAKFGRKGEGPGEFIGETCLNVQPNYLLIESSGKISYFSRQGEYIREKICPGKGGLKGLTPFAGKFVGRGSPWFDPGKKIRYITLSFYDRDFIEGSRITRTPARFQNDGSVWFMNGTFNFKVYGRFLFVQYHGKPFKLDCFNQAGNLEFTIENPDFEYRKVTPEDKKRALDHIKKYMPWVYNQRQRIKFPEYWSGVGTFFIDGESQRIFIITYVKNTRNDSLFYIYDLTGKFIRKCFLPVGERNIWAPYPLAIAAGRLFQLRENVEQEHWVLHITEI